MDTQVCSLNACNYSDINKNTKIFSVDMLDYFLYVYLNPEIATNCVIYQVDEIVPDTKQVHMSGVFDRESNCWLKIVKDGLNLSEGMHVYKLSMVNKVSDETILLYFSYVIRNSNADRPYKYMNSCGRCTVCNNCKKA